MIREQNTHWDAYKGLLILLIVLGHNPLLELHLPEIRRTLYGFHVIGFLLLPFLYPSAPFSRALVKKYALRYYVPFLWFYTLAAILFVSVLAKDASASAWLQSFFLGIIVGSAYWVDQASDLEMFWFLPTLFGLVIARSLYASASQKIQYGILAICIILHLTASLMPDWAAQNLPFNPLIIAYVFPLGLLFVKAIQFVETKQNKWVNLWIIVFALAVAISPPLTNMHLSIEELSLYNITQPIGLVMHGLFILSMLVSFFIIAHYAKRYNWLTILGRHSLIIYLAHPFFLYGIFVTSPKTIDAKQWALYLLLTTFISVVASLIVSRLIRHSPYLSAWITPHGAAVHKAQ